MTVSRRVMLAAGSGLILTGCLPSGTGTSGSNSGSSSTPGASAAASTSATADPAAIAAATAMVRADLPAIGSPVATLKINSDKPAIDGATIHLWEIRSTGSSAVLTWALTHPTSSNATISDEHLPTLRVGDTVYRLSQSQRFAGIWVDICARQAVLMKEPRPTFALYAPLPDDVTDVTVGCDSSKDAVKLTVQRGPSSHPQGTSDIPILGRALALDRNHAANSIPMVITIHGVRRLTGATAVYFSLTGQDSGEQPNPYDWTSLYYIMRQDLVGVPLLGTYLVDHPNLTGYSGLDWNGSGIGPRPTQLYNKVMMSGSAAVCWTLLPPLPDGVTEVDATIAGQYFFSLPVQDGPMTPVSADPIVALGAGWPAITEKDLAKPTAEKIEVATATIRDNVTTKSITKTGGGNVELDANVLFDYDKSTLTPKAASLIATAAEDIQATGKTGQLTITGHTDSDGTDSYNQQLSEARAQTVANALKKQLPSSYTYKVVGAGEKQPIASNDTTKGRARNRRVTIALPGQ